MASFEKSSLNESSSWLFMLGTLLGFNQIRQGLQELWKTDKKSRFVRLYNDVLSGASAIVPYVVTGIFGYQASSLQQSTALVPYVENSANKESGPKVFSRVFEKVGQGFEDAKEYLNWKTAAMLALVYFGYQYWKKTGAGISIINNNNHTIAPQINLTIVGEPGTQMTEKTGADGSKTYVFKRLSET